MKNRQIVSLSALLIFSFTVVAAKDEPAELHKIYHHRDEDPDSAYADVELGKIFFHFSKKPIMNEIPQQEKQRAHQELLFFFPHLKIAKEARAMMKDLNEYVSPWYSVQLKSVETPIMGVSCTIRFDPLKVSFSMGDCDSIVTQKNGMREKCLELKFHNKVFLDKISRQNKPVLRLTDAGRTGVVIDCGHGGTDHGAISAKNLAEKDVTMKVGLHVAQLLHNKGIDVFLTRDADTTVPLNARTFFANTCKKAGLLVSIHANFSQRKEASGIETFCLDENLFNYGFTTLHDDALKNILSRVDRDRNKKSFLLAQALQHSTLEYAKKKQQTVVDRKVKHSVSQMLAGTNMPGALIEIGFLSHKEEAQLLSDKEYQFLIAQGICDGILSYMKIS